VIDDVPVEDWIRLKIDAAAEEQETENDRKNRLFLRHSVD